MRLRELKGFNTEGTENTERIKREEPVVGQLKILRPFRRLDLGLMRSNENYRGFHMKRRIVLWATVGLLVGCVWVAYAFLTAPDIEQRSAANMVVHVLAYVACPIIAVGPRFYWIPLVNAATYALLGFARESIRGISK